MVVAMRYLPFTVSEVFENMSERLRNLWDLSATWREPLFAYYSQYHDHDISALPFFRILPPAILCSWKSNDFYSLP
jgi:hypothetical protein